MTAMSSIFDVSMLKLDFVTGVVAIVLFNLIRHGRSNIHVKHFADIRLWLTVVLVLVSRVLVDGAVHYHDELLGGNEYAATFGGSTAEMVSGALVWLVLASLLLLPMLPKKEAGSHLQHNVLDVATLFGSNALVLFAVARLTGWG